MTDPQRDKPGDDPSQRESLMESERRAHAKHPQNLREEENAEKVVDVENPKPGGSPIQRIDPGGGDSGTGHTTRP